MWFIYAGLTMSGIGLAFILTPIPKLSQLIVKGANVGRLHGLLFGAYLLFGDGFEYIFEKLAPK